MGNSKIKGGLIRRAVVRYALRIIKNNSDYLGGVNYAILNKWGIGDIMKNPHTQEPMYIIDPDL